MPEEQEGLILIGLLFSHNLFFEFYRYGTQWEAGFVTTYKGEDLSTLRALLNDTPEPITKAGLHPTADQIELYAYHLPNAALSNLMVCGKNN